MNKKDLNAPQKVLKNGQICQEELDEIVSIALESLKSLMVDYETPIEIRLQVALKLFEIGATPNKNNDEVLIRSIEKNALDIKKNAHQLSGIESLLKMVAQSTPDAIFPNAIYSQKINRTAIR